MDVQHTLTLAIEVIFWAFISLIIFDFANRIFGLEVPNTTPAMSFTPDIVSEPAPIAVPVITPQMELLPDPWVLDVESPIPSVDISSVLLTFPTLKLLPSAKEVKQKSKRSKTSQKTKPTTKAPSTKTPQKGRPRKQAA